MNNFHVSRFRELLKKEEAIKKSRKSFFYVNPEEYFELGLLRSKIRDEYYFQNYVKYFWRIKNFLETKEPETRWAALQTYQLITKLIDMQTEDENQIRKLTYLYYEKDRKFFDPSQQQKDLEKLFAASMTNQSKGFSKLICGICDEIIDWYYLLEWKDRKDWNDDLEGKFRNFLAKIFGAMQQYLM